MVGWNIKYPNVNDEILNLDWILTKLKEMDGTLNGILEGDLGPYFDKYFNSFMMDAIYTEALERIELKKQPIISGEGVHIYDYDEEEMIIDGGN